MKKADREFEQIYAFVPGEELDSRYLFLYLQSPQFLEQFAGLQNGPRKGAGVSQVKKLTIPILPLAKQKQLVERIDQLQKQNGKDVAFFQTPSLRSLG